MTEIRSLVISTPANVSNYVAEFALVKVRGSQLDAFGAGGAFAGHVARWLGKRLDASLAECLPIVKQKKHTPYPICETFLDDAIGIRTSRI